MIELVKNFIAYCWKIPSHASGMIIGGSRGGAPGVRPPFAWHPSSLADLGGAHPVRAPHLPGILVFDDILGHMV